MQNRAVKKLTPEAAQKFTKNNLFIIERNLYQASCGHSRSAIFCIDGFPAKTKGLAEDKRRALLDGMLFEAFFDKSGNIRREFKDGSFSRLFDLQRFESHALSFEFIAECLLPYGNRFHALPGKAVEIALDIVLEPEIAPNARMWRVSVLHRAICFAQKMRTTRMSRTSPSSIGLAPWKTLSTGYPRSC